MVEAGGSTDALLSIPEWPKAALGMCLNGLFKDSEPANPNQAKIP